MRAPSSPGVPRAVQNTRELARIIALPRRDWTEEEAEQLALELSPLLRTPNGTMHLRPVQAQSLIEAGILGGLFAAIRAGGGKTLFSLLVAYVLDAKRPLLLLPAKLIGKTKREMRVLGTHWRIPNYIRFLSYELLGRNQSQKILDEFQPDLIIADEAYKLKNRKAACTKRVGRYKLSHLTCKMVAMTGTITKRSPKDFAHVLLWCLGPRQTPLPNSFTELEDFADAIEEKTITGSRIGIGALALLQNATERADPDQLSATRSALGRRMTETPGVVATSDGFTGATLTIQALWDDQEVIPSAQVDAAFELLRTKWRTPDDWPLTDAMSVWRVRRELSLGFYNRWVPRPPKDWMDARREWSKYARDILTDNRRNLDSDKQVLDAVDAGYYPMAKPSLDEWRRIKDTFEPNSQPVWLDDSMIKACTLWALKAPGIVWTEHVPFALELAKHAKLAYYGKQGKDSRGREIEDHDPSEGSLIASVASNAEGRNLQAWSRNLLTAFPSNGVLAEQLLARTHRDGQLEDEVVFDCLVTSVAHVMAYEQALKDATYIQTYTRQAQRLLYADKIFPGFEDILGKPGERWIKNV